MQALGPSSTESKDYGTHMVEYASHLLVQAMNNQGDFPSYVGLIVDECCLLIADIS